MFAWKDEYSCGIAAIDAQHKQLFVLANELHRIATAKDGYDHYDEILGVFHKLEDYTVYHFGFEEQLMEDCNFAAQSVKEHKMEHGAFIWKLRKVAAEDLDKGEKKVVLDVIMFAVDWIEKHILHTDMKYKDVLQACGH